MDAGAFSELGAAGAVTPSAPNSVGQVETDTGSTVGDDASVVDVVVASVEEATVVPFGRLLEVEAGGSGRGRSQQRGR